MHENCNGLSNGWLSSQNCLRTYIFSLSLSHSPRVVHMSENVYYRYKFSCPWKYANNKSIMSKHYRQPVGGIYKKKNLTKLRKCCLWIKTWKRKKKIAHKSCMVYTYGAVK
jgi:hypothetical protein